MFRLLSIVLSVLLMLEAGNAASTITSTVVKSTTRASFAATTTQTVTTTRTYFQKPYGLTTTTRTTTSTVTNTTYTTQPTQAGFTNILDSLPGASSAPDYFTPSPVLNNADAKRSAAPLEARAATVTITRTSTIFTQPPSGTKTVRSTATTTTVTRPTRTITSVVTHSPAKTVNDPDATSYDACSPSNFANRVQSGNEVYPLNSLDLIDTTRFTTLETGFIGRPEDCCSSCFARLDCLMGLWDSTNFCKQIVLNETSGATCSRPGQYNGGPARNNAPFRIGLGPRDRGRNYDLIIFNGICGRGVGSVQFGS